MPKIAPASVFVAARAALLSLLSACGSRANVGDTEQAKCIGEQIRCEPPDDYAIRSLEREDSLMVSTGALDSMAPTWTKPTELEYARLVGGTDGSVWAFTGQDSEVEARQYNDGDLVGMASLQAPEGLSFDDVLLAGLTATRGPRGPSVVVGWRKPAPDTLLGYTRQPELFTFDKTIAETPTRVLLSIDPEDPRAIPEPFLPLYPARTQDSDDSFFVLDSDLADWAAVRIGADGRLRWQQVGFARDFWPTLSPSGAKGVFSEGGTISLLGQHTSEYRAQANASGARNLILVDLDWETGNIQQQIELGQPCAEAGAALSLDAKQRLHVVYAVEGGDLVWARREGERLHEVTLLREDYSDLRPYTLDVDAHGRAYLHTATGPRAPNTSETLCRMNDDGEVACRLMPGRQYEMSVGADGDVYTLDSDHQLVRWDFP